MLRALDLWLPGYIRSRVSRPRGGTGVRDLFFCLADHFEPFHGGAARSVAVERVRRWSDGYSAAVEGLRDHDGRGPRHSFFYPAEEYDPACVGPLAALCARTGSETEVHLHHRNDDAEGLRTALETFRDRLRRDHGFLGSDGRGRVRYGFIHGNWALCNSRPDGDWCGVNEELGVLAGTGCYADFTYPSAPSPTQPRIVNTIYRSRDRPGRARSHDRGERVGAGTPFAEPPEGGGLMMIQGPLAFDWSDRKWGCLPRIENGALDARRGARPARADLWVRCGIHVAGRPDWIFVKVHTHGATEENAAALLEGGLRGLYGDLCSRYNDARTWRLHFVTAREMYNFIRAAEAGARGPPDLSAPMEVGLPPLLGGR